MARSPLTLAASVTSALPRVGVVGAGLLTEGAAGRYDSAVADLDDGRRVVVRVPNDPEADSELVAGARALRALTPGVRKLLPFHAPELLGEASLGDARAVVVTFLPGYRVDAQHLPPGRGAATSIGEALAAVHALPVSIARDEGLPVRTPGQTRVEADRVVSRAEATNRVPATLIRRWRRALDADELWQFESAVVLGGVGSPAFLLQDIDGVPTVTGLLDWHGLSVGDPAIDLQWLASAPTAASDVFEAYTAHSHRAPDGLVRERARLYAELEFAKWLLHGHDTERDDIVDDAVRLLESLAEGVGGEDLIADAAFDVDDAIALLGRTPDAPPAVDTSMHTDAYDPDELAAWVQADADESSPDVDTSDANDGSGVADEADAGAALFAEEPDAQSTAPIDVSALAGDDVAAEPQSAAPGAANSESGWADGPDAELDEAERASRAAFQRWTSSASE